MIISIAEIMAKNVLPDTDPSIVFADVSGDDYIWSTQINLEPENPNNCITVYEPPSPKPSMALDKVRPTLWRPAFMIRVRSLDRGLGRAKLQNIMFALLAIRNLPVNGPAIIQAVLPKGQPYFLERDNQNRHIHQCNFEAAMAETEP